MGVVGPFLKVTILALKNLVSIIMRTSSRPDHSHYTRLFSDFRTITQGEKNLKLKNFLPKTQNSGIFSEIQEDFYPNVTIFI